MFLWGGIKGLLLWGTKGEHLIWEISEGNIWTEGWERTETKVQKSRQVGNNILKLQQNCKNKVATMLCWGKISSYFWCNNLKWQNQNR